MGIRGLTGFIDRNPHLLHAHELHDCSVIIDGNNLYHFLYYGRHVRCTFGGDYDVYRKRIIKTFQSFEECGIHPYIIFDGAYTKDGRKLKTSLSRAKARIRLVDCVTNTERGQALPALAYETFIQTLNELHIPHATCQFEADSEIAVLANKMNCPVISNDSDFFIFDVPAGFLPLDYVDFNVLTKIDEKSGDAYKFLFVRRYHIDELIESFDGLSRSVLPVFASMLGNDVINASAFQSFYSKFKVPKVVSKKFHLPAKLHKVINVLHWLHSSHDNLSEIMENLLEFVHFKQREKVKKMLTTSVEGYCNIHTFEGYDLYTYLNSISEGTSIFGISKEFEQYGGTPFPQWFLTAGSSGQLSTFIFNTAVLHQVIILCQMEDLTQASSYKCSSQIRQVFYGILVKDEVYNQKFSNVVETLEKLVITSKGGESNTTVDNSASTDNIENCPDAMKNKEQAKNIDVDISGNTDNTYIYTKQPIKECFIEEYERLNKGLKKSVIYPVFEIEDQIVPGLAELSNMSMESRTAILWAALQIDNTWIKEFTNDMELFVACLVIWLRSPDTKLSLLHLDTVVVCAILLHVQSEQERRLKENEVIAAEKKCSLDTSILNLVETCKNSSSDCLDKIKLNSSKYHHQAPVFNRKTVYDPCITHVFAQLQACMVDTLNLNKILCQPIPNLKPFELINGTLLYNLLSELETRPRPDLFLASLLENSYLHQFHTLMRLKIISYVGEECFLNLSSTRTYRKRRKRKCKEEMTESTEQQGVEIDANDEDFSVVAGFDVANKFSLLSTI